MANWKAFPIWKGSKGGGGGGGDGAKTQKIKKF